MLSERPSLLEQRNKVRARRACSGCCQCLNGCGRQAGVTALFVAVRHGDVPLASLLIEAGADLKVRVKVRSGAATVAAATAVVRALRG
jgi:hypothetical protein